MACRACKALQAELDSGRRGQHGDLRRKAITLDVYDRNGYAHLKRAEGNQRPTIVVSPLLKEELDHTHFQSRIAGLVAWGRSPDYVSMPYDNDEDEMLQESLRQRSARQHRTPVLPDTGSVDLGYSQYWDSRAASFSGGKAPREIFSDSLQKMYHTLQRNYQERIF
eukprot:m.60703 g.60703  ORF g.60703 m.60703 type:complete len:166 (+) comp49392_c0_seq2:1-498(+)